MSLITRLFGPRAAVTDVRPLWHRTIEIAREKPWYKAAGIADTVPGRFDAITLVLSLVLLRMEREPTLIEPSVRLTEIFVEDMDGQLRESGVGDLAVGKHMGKLMGVLGGRLGAYRTALASDGPALADAVARNVTLGPDGDADRIAAEMRLLAAQLADLPTSDLLAGNITR
ncbi:ubiquinol-cytochrome C chaperone family protein [Novosphingobium lentum]|uniref:ubiquinol-cytochrome C chaperone family protein n=1 Tax=Novosphingobium lentum TaxID=145287 RepID=UPI000833EF5A|nr:ubiquinol-cytochrome C chaperone family protein [Novosphingobium lentum]